MIKGTTIEAICEAINAEEGFTEKLPDEGIIHFDKILPYICVYRFKENPDPYFTRLLKTQGSYLIIKDSLPTTEILSTISNAIVEKLNAFLILELWPLRQNHEAEFSILCPKDRAPATVKTLEEGFEEMRLIYPKVSVNVIYSNQRHPDYLNPLLDIDTSKDVGSLVIGLGVSTLYEQPEEEEIYSLFFRKFFTRFSEVIKRAVYEFIRVQTANPFNHYLMLGKTHLDKPTLQVDDALAEISHQMDFLLRVTPVNSNTAWKKFQESNFEKQPPFTYRLIALDPELTKRKLYNLPIDQIQDPTLAHILRDKRLEIEKQLIMLEERGTKNFRFTGESLYGIISPKVFKAAKEILEHFPVHLQDNQLERYNCHQFAEHAQKEIDFYQEQFPNLEIKLEIRKDIAGIMVSQSHLLISDELNMDAKRTDALIQHEVATHILTYCNGKMQPLKQMQAGFAGYDKLQEGLAVMAEYLVGGLTKNRLRLLAARVIAVDKMVQGSTFCSVFHFLKDNYNFPPKTAYFITMRVYRGGGLTKDGVYLSGLLELMEYMKKEEDISILFAGKFNHNHIPLIKELTLRGVVKKPLQPRYLDRPDVKERLKKINSGISLPELVQS